MHGFISSNRITDFVQSYKLKIVQNLVPGLRKEGYTESPENTYVLGVQSEANILSESSSSDRPSSQSGQGQPRFQAPRAPTPPYPRHDPFGVYPSHVPSNNPLSIGRQDLDPLPAHPNPFGPSPLFGGPSRGDGMFVGPGHPIFSDRFTPGRGGGIGGHGHHEGPWGGDGFLPPMGAPPGARFDPVGPFGSPSGQGPGRGGPFGGAGGAGGPLRRHDPDNDEFMPPGVVRYLFVNFRCSLYAQFSFYRGTCFHKCLRCVYVRGVYDRNKGCFTASAMLARLSSSRVKCRFLSHYYQSSLAPNDELCSYASWMSSASTYATVQCSFIELRPPYTR